MTNLKNLKKTYISMIERCNNINELVWVQCDVSEDRRLGAMGQIELLRAIDSKREVFEAAGDVYRRAVRPAFMK